MPNTHASSMLLRARLAPLIRRRGIRATARGAGVHHAMLVDWLQGRRDIPVDVLVKLASRFGLVVELVDADPYPSVKVTVPRRRPSTSSAPAR